MGPPIRCGAPYRIVSEADFSLMGAFQSDFLTQVETPIG